MSYYWDSKFLQHLDINNVRIIFEVGARYGDETKKLKTVFPNSSIFSFECNPNTINICEQNLHDIEGVYFNAFGLGEYREKLPFYSYIANNDGASSFLKRIDFHNTQIQNGFVDIFRLDDFVKTKKIQTIDLLCMDIQGYELNVLKGAGNFINNINYIIMEEPKPIINSKYLPNGIHSKYINAPTSQDIKQFMNEYNFIEIERIEENQIEDNVMYKKCRKNDYTQYYIK
jgi:FkbM family methyltransferase